MSAKKYVLISVMRAPTANHIETSCTVDTSAMMNTTKTIAQNSTSKVVPPFYNYL